MPTPAVPQTLLAWRRDFGRHLRALREERQLTQETLAEMAGVDRKLVYRTELGQTSPRLDAVVQIAAALQVAPAELVSPRRSRPSSRR